MRKVYLENLPIKPHNDTTVIDWKELNGHKVKFKHDEMEGKIKMYYSHTKRYVHYIKCVYNNKEKNYPVQTIQKGAIGSLVNPNPKTLKPTEENSLYQRKDLHKFVYNPEDLKNYHKSSNKHYNFICPSCDEELRKRINSVIRNGVSCDICSSSYPKNERLVSIILTKIKLKYISQKYFDGCKIEKLLPFDFYIPSLNIVIETHGMQHYKEVEYFNNHEDTKKSDKIKKEFCKNNDIKYYEIDCSKRDSVKIIQQLKDIINVNLSEEELKECMFESMHNVSEIDLKIATNLYNNYWSFREIGEHFKISPSRIRTLLLDSGVELRQGTNYTFENSLIDLVSGEIYGNITDLYNKKMYHKNDTYIARYLKQGKVMIGSEGDNLCIVKRTDLQIRKDKSHLKRVYNEAMKQLNENKVDRFEGLVGKDIEELINNSTNQKELMLLLDNLPKEYYIQNGIVYKN